MNFWDTKFSENPFLYGREPNSFLCDSLLFLKPGSKILSLGEGEGRNAIFLAQQGFQVTALDASVVGLNRLKSVAIQQQVTVETICCDLSEFEFERDKWDAIVSIWCHLPSKLRRFVHQAIPTSLKKSGVFIAEAYHPNQLRNETGGPKDMDLLVTLQQFKDELSPLEVQMGVEKERMVSEGIGHTGMSFVVQFIGKK